MDDTKVVLSEKELPKAWYNIQADLPQPLPPILHPGTKEPTQLPPQLFSEALNEQEFNTKDAYIEIPHDVFEIYKLWRPTPLYRAKRLEKALGTPAKIFYKYEGVSPSGSHKLNTAIPQAYYNKLEGIKRLATETGAGQWGSSLAIACQFFGMELKVYMVKSSFYQKPYRKIMMETFGAKCIPSPSMDTEIGRKILAEDPDCPGSLGIAISEACEDAFSREDTRYTLGSVLNHVLMHQTVIGLETQKEMDKIGIYPDMIIGCVGGGSNFGGLAIPYVRDMIKGKHKNTEIIAVEPTACPTMTKGPYTWDLGDTGGMAPITKMHTLGHSFIPPAVHSGGLRYHGMSPLVSHLANLGYIKARAVNQIPTFEAAVLFARNEGIIPAPEPSHAIRVAIDEALKCKETGEKKNILIALSGHGYFDLSAYEKYFAGELTDYDYPEAKVKEALSHLPIVDNKY